MFHPYNLAMKIEKHFADSSEEPLVSEDFYNVVEALQATGSEKNQTKAADFFMTLSKQEVILRAAAVARLGKLLQIIKINKNVVPSSPSP
jgi:hypothetical protein